MRKSILAATIAAGVLVAAGCVQPPPPPPDTLAVAYSNLDGVDGFDAAGDDVLISKIVDTNNDGVVSADDTVILGNYPLDFDATTFGSFDDPVHTVTSTTFWVDQFKVGVDIGQFSWSNLSSGHGAAGFDYGTGGGQLSWNVIDRTDNIPSGQLKSDLRSPGSPDVSIPLQSSPVNSADEPFVDVDIFF